MNVVERADVLLPGTTRSPGPIQKLRYPAVREAQAHQPSPESRFMMIGLDLSVRVAESMADCEIDSDL